MNRARVLVAALSAVLGLLSPAFALAQSSSTPSPRASAPLPTDAELRIKQAVLASFRVLPVQNGIILVPNSRRQGVDNVEVRDGTVAINGTVVTGGELRERLGRDGDIVLELSYLDLNAQRRLLLPDRGAPAPTAAPPAEGAAERGDQGRPEPGARQDENATAATREFRRVSDGRVRVGGPITVGEDEEVRGAVVAVGGSVEINGRVRDEVVAVGGSIRLGPRAEVYGDITSVGGSLSRDPSAVVRGHVNEIEFSWPNIHVRPIRPWAHFDPWWTGGPWRTVQLVGTLVRMALFALLAALLLLLAPRPVERVAMAVRSEPWKSALVGFFAQLIFVPLLIVTIVFLVISIIGIPLLVLVPFLVLGFFAALLLGFTGTASAVAHGTRDRFTWARGNVPLLLLGLLVIWGFTLVGRVFVLPGGPFAFVGGMLLLVGFLVEYAAWTVGLGGAILTRFGRAGRLYPPPIPPEVAADLGGREAPPLS